MFLKMLLGETVHVESKQSDIENAECSDTRELL